jgi:hypothetical protein
LSLRSEVLGRRLDHDIHVAKISHARRRLDQGHRRRLLLGRHLFLLDQAVKAARNRRHALLHRRVVDVQHHRRDAHHRAGLRDAIAHGAGADDAYFFDRHLSLPGIVVLQLFILSRRKRLLRRSELESARFERSSRKMRGHVSAGVQPSKCGGMPVEADEDSYARKSRRQ